MAPLLPRGRRALSVCLYTTSITSRSVYKGETRYALRPALMPLIPSLSVPPGIDCISFLSCILYIPGEWMPPAAPDPGGMLTLTTELCSCSYSLLDRATLAFFPREPYH